MGPGYTHNKKQGESNDALEIFNSDNSPFDYLIRPDAKVILTDSEKLEREAEQLFNSPGKDFLNYTVGSAGCIGPGPLSKVKEETSLRAYLGKMKTVLNHKVFRRYSTSQMK